ncbi:MAG TPA: hypothetical protein VK502_04495 [Candidatus Saccharimonadales bacterium]|nr:hypothetical protein [Candidatus Saccharimonadales bacterium]
MRVAGLVALGGTLDEAGSPGPGVRLGGRVSPRVLARAGVSADGSLHVCGTGGLGHFPAPSLALPGIR